MNIIPGFLLKKIYKKGSLRETQDGVAFDLKNIIGPGLVTGINYIKINDVIYNSSVIKIINAGVAVLAEQISTDNPMLFKMNDEVTCVIQNCLNLKNGINQIIVELISKDVGKVCVALTDDI